MPGVSGVHLACLLREVAPGLRVILTSGFPVDSWDQQDIEYIETLGPKAVRVLTKPFPPMALVKMVQELLEEPLSASASLGAS